MIARHALNHWIALSARCSVRCSLHDEHPPPRSAPFRRTSAGAGADYPRVAGHFTPVRRAAS